MGPTVEGTFRILDQASPSFDKIMAKAKGTDKAVNKVGKTLDEVAAKTKADTKVMKEGLEGVGKQSDETTTKATIGWKEFEKRVSTATRGITGDAAKLKAALKEVEGKYHIDITGKGELIESTVLARQLKRELNAVQREQAKAAASQLGLAAGGGMGGGGPGLGSRLGGALTPFGILPSIAAAALAPVVDLTGAVGALAGSLGEAAIGAGALAVGGIGIGGVGLAGVISVAIPAIKKIGELKKAQDSYNEAVSLYGKNSTQAVTAAKKLLVTQKAAGPMNGFNPAQLTALGKGWQRLTKEGQGAFFGMLSRNIKRTKHLLPDFAESANRSMKGAAGGVDVFMKKLDGPEFRHFLDRMTDAFVHDVRPIARILSNTGRVFGRIAVATIPSIHEMVGGLEDATEGWVKSTDNAGKLRDHIEDLVGQTKDWFKLLGAGWDLMKSAFGAGAGEGQGMVRSMTRQFREWDKWIVTHPAKVKDFFQNAREGTGDLFRAIGSFVPTIQNFYTAFRPISSVIGTTVEGLNKLKIGNVTALTGLLGYLTVRRMRNSLLGGGGSIMGSRGPAAPGSLANPIAVLGVGGPGGVGVGRSGKGRGTVVGVPGAGASTIGGRLRNTRAGKAAAATAAAAALKFPRGGQAVERGLGRMGAAGSALKGLGKIPLLGTGLFALGAANSVHGGGVLNRTASGLEMLDPTALAGAFGIGPERGLLNAAFTPLIAKAGGDLSAPPAEMITDQAKSAGVPTSFAFNLAMKGMGLTGILNRWNKRQTTNKSGLPQLPGGGMIGSGLFDALDHLESRTGKVKEKVNTNTKAMTDTSSKNVERLGSVFGSTMDWISKTTDKGLRAMGAKPTGWTVMDRPGAMGPPTPTGKRGAKNAYGGYIPGKGKADTVPVPGGMAAPGEAWMINGPSQMRINRMLRPYGTSIETEIGRETRPHNVPAPQNARHARGGRTSTMTPSGMMSVGRWAQSMGLSVGEGPGFGGVPSSGHAAGSLHYSGLAYDVSGAASLMARFRRAAELKYMGRGLNELFYDPFPYYIDNGGKVSGSIGGHSDHVHIGFFPSGPTGAGRLGGMGSMGGMSAKLMQLRRKKLRGPGGKMMGIAQGGIDAVTGSANAMLRKRGGGGGRIQVGGSGVEASIARVLFGAGLNKVGAAGIIGNAYAESTMNPAATGYGGGGLWGFTSSPYSLADLQSYAGSKNQSWTNPALQTRFLLQFIRGLIPRLNASGTPEAAANLFMTEFERPGIPRLDVREQGARNAFSRGYTRGGRTMNWGGWHAQGGTFKVNRPTLFGAGEAGAETVHITKGGDRNQRQYVVHIAKIENHRKGDIRRILEEEFDKLGDEVALANAGDD